MKKSPTILIVSFCLSIFVGCKKDEVKATSVLGKGGEPNKSIRKPSRESDESDIQKSCNAPGYFWSITKSDCVIPANVGLRLWDGKHANENAYIIISEDKNQVELFYPGKSTSVMLNHMSKGSGWENGSYQIYYTFGSDRNLTHSYGLRIKSPIWGWSDKYSTDGGFMNGV